MKSLKTETHVYASPTRPICFINVDSIIDYNDIEDAREFKFIRMRGNPHENVKIVDFEYMNEASYRTELFNRKMNQQGVVIDE